MRHQPSHSGVGNVVIATQPRFRLPSTSGVMTREFAPASRLKAEIARILQDEGYIQGYKLVDDTSEKTTAPTKILRLFLKYGPHGEKLITGVQRISRPGRRVYFGRDDVPDVLAGLGTSILTTSRGVMTGRAAVKAGVGGEVLCNIW